MPRSADTPLIATASLSVIAPEITTWSWSSAMSVTGTSRKPPSIATKTDAASPRRMSAL